MKITCPNASCGQHLSGPRALMGSRFTCPRCDHSFIWTDRFHAGDAFVIYDLETTGLYPESDEFIQIGAVRLRAGCVCPEESFFSFARPGQRISPFITSYTGMSNDHVRDAPREAQGIDSIHISKRLFGKTRGIGHSLDHVKMRLGLRDTSLRRLDARDDVDLPGRAVEEMARRLDLDTSSNGVPRHATLLPHA